MYALVDCLQKALKTSVTATGSDLPTALLEYIRANDSAVLEACEKVTLQINGTIILTLLTLRNACMCFVINTMYFYSCWLSSKKRYGPVNHSKSFLMSWVSHMTCM